MLMSTKSTMLLECFANASPTKFFIASKSELEIRRILDLYYREMTRQTITIFSILALSTGAYLRSAGSDDDMSRSSVLEERGRSLWQRTLLQDMPAANGERCVARKPKWKTLDVRLIGWGLSSGPKSCLVRESFRWTTIRTVTLQ